MKKSLLALAVLGAFAGAASAQSSVTIYGIVDASVASIDNGGDGRVNRLDSGNNAASRIGFKGVEDLGNGLKAEFVLENGFNVDDGRGAGNSGPFGNTGGTGGFSRLAYLGLNGSFGTIRAGRQNSQIKEAISIIDPFGSSGIMNGVDYLNGGNVQERVSNQITWNSNNYGGFSGRVGYRFGEVEDENSSNNGFGVQLGYANGPLAVQFGYDKQNYDGGISGVAAGTDADVKDAILGATYDFGAFKLHGAYGQKKYDAGVLDAGAESNKIKSGMIGVSVPFGASKIRAEYIKNSDDRDDFDNSVFAVGYSYALSKRTQFYATYAYTNNDDNSTMGVGGAGSAEVAGENTNGFAIGIQHNF